MILEFLMIKFTFECRFECIGKDLLLTCVNITLSNILLYSYYWKIFFKSIFFLIYCNIYLLFYYRIVTFAKSIITIYFAIGI